MTVLQEWTPLASSDLRADTGPSQRRNARYLFEDYELDESSYTLTAPSGPVHVEPQVFDVLRYLIANRHRVVSKEELLDAVWGTRFVSESALTSRVKAARRAIGDDGRGQRLIRTVYRRGYQFAAEVDVPGVKPDVVLGVRRRRNWHCAGWGRASRPARQWALASGQLRLGTRRTA